MAITVHHFSADPSRVYKLHLWNRGHVSFDLAGTHVGNMVVFNLPISGDARDWQFKYHWTDSSHKDTWEEDSLERHFRVAAPTNVWTFESAARVVYEEPFPAGVSFPAGDVLSFHLITVNRFVGGRLYVWDPYNKANAALMFGETSRTGSVSLFQAPLAAWMTKGFNFKFVGPKKGNDEYWEPDASNRVWRPVDGKNLWLKSGQANVRKIPLTLNTFSVEALFSALAPTAPTLTVRDPIDDTQQSLSPTIAPYAGSPLFNVGTYAVSLYPEAYYTLTVDHLEGSTPYVRSFPSPAASAGTPSRLIVGDDRWVSSFPHVVAETVVIAPLPGSTSFAAGLNVDVATQIGPRHQTVPAVLQADGRYSAVVSALEGVRNALRLSPVGGNEIPLYDWVDRSRFFTPRAGSTTCYTAERVFGTSTVGTPSFAEPPSRQAVMEAAFGKNIVGAGVFAPDEMPHGPTLVGGDRYFVVHAPHAVTAELILVDDAAAGGPARRPAVAMQLTFDTRYWWCKVPAAQALPGTRYRFLLNATDEVMDPAAREVFDSGNFETSPKDNPGDKSKSWAVVMDESAVRAAAHQAPWETMGWEALVIYELHAKRLTNHNPFNMSSLDLIADQLGTGKYLACLPVTALELLPVNEFKTSNSWGYNTAFYFAIDSGYGGAPALARMVNAAHAAGRAVLLDLVYNHMLDSPLMKIAKDVYCNGNAWGDRMNSGHPIVQEFLRQAIVYHWRTFGLDGFRFDDTKTILNNIDGWKFLNIMRNAVRGAATAERKRWPYCAAENERDDEKWNVTNPRWSVMDGMWDLDEVYKIRDCTYDGWQPSNDHAGDLAGQTLIPQSWYRPYYCAVRYGESHDMVSGQDSANRRIAARPPFRQGFQMSKAMGALVLLSNGVPMLFMGQEVGETRYFSFDNDGPVTNPQDHDLAPAQATDQTRVLAWFRSLLGLRNDGYKGLCGDSNVMNVRTGHRTIAFTCGYNAALFVVVTFGTANGRQDSSWLGLPSGAAYKEIFNSSWPVFQVEFEAEQTNGGYDAQIYSGEILKLPYIGAVVLERR